ncbi:MAG: TolC family outer membrane protein [Rhodocyclaceae bacterium]
MKKTLMAGLIGLFSSSLWSADLLDVYRDALANDARFAAARAQHLAGQEAAVQGRAGLLPSIGASASTQWNRTEPEGADSSSYNSNAWGVQLTQPLLRMQNRAQARQGELQTSAADVQLELARQDLILRVSEAYFNVLNAEDALDALVQLRTAAAEQLQHAKTSFEVGTVTITDVHEAQSYYDLAVAQVIAAESTLDVAREALSRIVNRDVPDLATLRPGVELVAPEPADPDAWASAAEQGSRGVQLQLISRDIIAQEVRRSRAGHYPTVDLVASHGNGSRQGGSAGSADTSALGVQFNLPLYAGGAISSREREAAALRMKADSDLDDARRAAVLAARQAYVGVTSGMARVKALEAAELSSISSLEANRLGYEVGVRINIDVLNAQTQLADARRQLAQARYDTLLAQFRLKAAAGSLDEDDVKAVNALLVEQAAQDGRAQ